MVRIVQKYGGTSVASIDHIKSIAERIKFASQQGNELIVVVSARAGVTNELLRKAYSISTFPVSSELDALLYTGELETIALLSLTLNNLGINAVSRNAYQAGIITCSSFGNAKIKNIIGGDIEECLSQSKVVIVAGFQGIDEHLRPTTLGRGGSDLTAIAFAKRFDADRCEIYTDVDGVFTADPRIVKKPFFISEISHDALLRLTFFDNKVMQDRSVALAKKLGINFKISSSFNKSDSKGTVVTSDQQCNETCVIGLTYKKGLSLFCGVSQDDIFNDILQFFREKRIDLSFIKHGKLPTNDRFIDEVCIESNVFDRIEKYFLSIYSNAYKDVNCIHNLDRVDIVGVNLEYSSWLTESLKCTYRNLVFRSEYGKNGLSFLVKSENFNDFFNQLHNIIFQ